MKIELLNGWRVLTASLRRLPDFLIIGVQKGGTSSLFAYLDKHPGLKLSIVKEVHFFDLRYSRGINWYKSHFPLRFIQDKYKTGEASPYYLFHPLAAQRVCAHCPNVKLVVLLRNPADRAYSHYMMQHIRKIDPLMTFEEAISHENKRLEGEMEKIRKDPYYQSFSHQKLSYLTRGLYFAQIKEWLAYFKYEQFLFIRSEDFFTNPVSELTRVYNFLNITTEFPDDLSPENANSYEPMTEDIRARLDDFFAQDKKRLAGLLGDKFLWG